MGDSSLQIFTWYKINVNPKLERREGGGQSPAPPRSLLTQAGLLGTSCAQVTLQTRQGAGATGALLRWINQAAQEGGIGVALGGGDGVGKFMDDTRPGGSG